MAENFKLVSWETVRDFLGLDDENKKIRIEPIIESVSSQAESFIGYEISYKQREFLFCGNNSDHIFLPSAPLIQVLSVNFDAQRLFLDSTNLMSNEYFFNPEQSEVILYDKVFPIGRYNIKITYFSGWQTDSAPADITKAVCDCVSATWNKMLNNQFGIKQINQSDGTNTIFDLDVPFLAKQTFLSYRMENI